MTDIRIPPVALRADILFGGHARITGVVDELGTPGVYRVFLHSRATGALVAATYSDSEGNYIFENIALTPLGYYAVAFDHGDNPVNAAIADFITPEQMP